MQVTFSHNHQQNNASLKIAQLETWDSLYKDLLDRWLETISETSMEWDQQFLYRHHRILGFIHSINY